MKGNIIKIFTLVIFISISPLILFGQIPKQNESSVVFFSKVEISSGIVKNLIAIDKFSQEDDYSFIISKNDGIIPFRKSNQIYYRNLETNEIKQLIDIKNLSIKSLLLTSDRIIIINKNSIFWKKYEEKEFTKLLELANLPKFIDVSSNSKYLIAVNKTNKLLYGLDNGNLILKNKYPLNSILHFDKENNLLLYNPNTEEIVFYKYDSKTSKLLKEFGFINDVNYRLLDIRKVNGKIYITAQSKHNKEKVSFVSISVSDKKSIIKQLHFFKTYNLLRFLGFDNNGDLSFLCEDITNNSRLLVIKYSGTSNIIKEIDLPFNIENKYYYSYPEKVFYFFSKNNMENNADYNLVSRIENDNEKNEEELTSINESDATTEETNRNLNKAKSSSFPMEYYIGIVIIFFLIAFIIYYFFFYKKHHKQENNHQHYQNYRSTINHQITNQKIKRKKNKINNEPRKNRIESLLESQSVGK